MRPARRSVRGIRGAWSFAGRRPPRGYYRNPELTAQLFDDGWLDTGDLGYLLDGEIVITGRAKDLIIVNGRNVWPQDLEWSAEELPELRRGDVAAFSIDDDQAGETVVVLVQCRITDAAQREKLKRAEQRKASSFLYPPPIMNLYSP